MEIQLEVRDKQQMNTEADWIPLMDYANKSGVSLSTLRRYIKANKIPFKIEDGRYLLQFKETHSSHEQDLYSRLQAAREEIAELKMLIAIYEEQLAEPRPSSDDIFAAPLNQQSPSKFNGY